MLRCKDLADKASAYIDNELPLKTRLSVKMHLFMCYKCQRYVKQLKTTIQTLTGLRNNPTDLPSEKIYKELLEEFKKTTDT